MACRFSKKSGSQFHRVVETADSTSVRIADRMASGRSFQTSATRVNSGGNAMPLGSPSTLGTDPGTSLASSSRISLTSWSLREWRLGLENRSLRKGTQGSNPCLSACFPVFYAVSGVRASRQTDPEKLRVTPRKCPFTPLPGCSYTHCRSRRVVIPLDARWLQRTMTGLPREGLWLRHFSR